jgi:hypothetical protein
LCAFVSVLKEYTGPQRPGELISLLTVLDISFYYLVYLFILLQLGWTNATQKLFTNDACSRKFFMLFPLLSSSGDWLLCPSATLVPSCSQCATIKPTFLARYAITRGALVTAIEGDTTTVLPSSGPHASSS